jgi:hypothetical protein
VMLAGAGAKQSNDRREQAGRARGSFAAIPNFFHGNSSFAPKRNL